MNAPIASRFDWYESTMEVSDTDRVQTSLALALDASLARTRSRNGYARAWQLSREGEGVLATVYGGSNREGEVHVTITGDACDRGVPALRTLFPDHRVSRADVAVDVEADFAEVDAHALGFARERGLRHRLVTDSEGGATRYLGSPTSEVQVRIYKKSEQLRALDPARAHLVPDGIVRYEQQTRPGKRDVKEAASVLAPDDYWGMSRWGQHYVREALDIDAIRTATHHRRASDWERALRAIGDQYGPSVQRRAEDVGCAQAGREVLAALGVGAPDA